MATNNLTTEQIAKVYATYIGQKLQSCRGIVTLNAVDLDDLPDSADEFAKLILRPLSAITDEDAIEVIGLLSYQETKNAPNIQNLIAYLKSKQVDYCEKDYRVYQLLIQRGYAVPLFITPGHPDNGKTAIELGIAISNGAFKNQQE